MLWERTQIAFQSNLWAYHIQARTHPGQESNHISFKFVWEHVHPNSQALILKS